MAEISRPVHGCPSPATGWLTPCCGKQLKDILLEEPVTVVGTQVTCTGSVESLTQDVQVVTLATMGEPEEGTRAFRFTQVPRRVNLEQETVEMAILDAKVLPIREQEAS